MLVLIIDVYDYHLTMFCRAEICHSLFSQFLELFEEKGWKPRL